MITFDRNGIRFNYRVAGVCITDGDVLLWSAEGEDFMTLPGGRCELGESSTEALRRELREELGIEVEIGRLLWVVENFFRFDETDFHELGFYYEVTLPQGFEHLQRGRSYRMMDGLVSNNFEWFRLAELDTLRLVPSFLRDGLRNLPETTQRIEQRG